MPDFELISEYAPAGDQPKAIESLVRGLKEDKKDQVLLGVTGSGKTFTMANVIAQMNRPTLVLSHNKTLAAQLASEFKDPDTTAHKIRHHNQVVVPSSRDISSSSSASSKGGTSGFTGFMPVF